MSYPEPYGTVKDDTVLSDLEYLHQTYPAEVRKYHRRIAEILDKMDYEGSMIYDEYPDRYTLWHLTENIVKIMRQEEEQQQLEVATSQEKWEWMENLVQVLLCDEVYKRRHGGKRRFEIF